MEGSDELARLARLEASNRRLRFLAVAALVIATLGPIWLFAALRAKFYATRIYTASVETLGHQRRTREPPALVRGVRSIGGVVVGTHAEGDRLAG